MHVSNSLGQVMQVVEATASQQTLDLGALPAGTYSVTVGAPGQATVSQRGGG